MSKKLKEVFQKMMDGVIDKELLKFTSICQMYLTFYRQSRVAFDTRDKITIRKIDTGEEKTYEGGLLTDPDGRIETIYKKFMDFIEVKTGEKPDKYEKVVREFSEALFAYLFYHAYKVVDEIKGYEYIPERKPAAEGETLKLFPEAEDFIMKPVTLMEYYDYQVECYNLTNKIGDNLIKFIDREDDPVAAAIRARDGRDKYKEQVFTGMIAKSHEVMNAFRLIKDVIDASIKKWIAVIDALEVKKNVTSRDITTKVINYVPVSYAVEQSKFTDGELTDELRHMGIKDFALHLTVGEKRVLFGLQKLLAATKFKGNVEHDGSDDVDLGDAGIIKSKPPLVYFTMSELYDACNVTKAKSERGYMEYDNNEKMQVYYNLMLLAKKNYCFMKDFEVKSSKGPKFYTTVDEETGQKKTVAYTKERRPKKFTAQFTEPLIRLGVIYEGLTAEEKADIIRRVSQDLPAGEDAARKVAGYVMRPSTILYHGLPKKDFIMKNPDMFIELSQTVEDVSFYLVQFIDYLDLTYRHMKSNNPDQTELTRHINIETMIDRLHMDGLAQQRQHKRIKAIINQCCEDTVKLGYLLKYEADVVGASGQLMLVLYFNPEHFYQKKKKGTS